MKKFFGPIFAGWPDCKWTKKSSFDAGNSVCVEYAFDGSSTKYPDLPVETWDCAVLVIEPGKIVESRFYYDTGSVPKQREQQGV